MALADLHVYSSHIIHKGRPNSLLPNKHLYLAGDAWNDNLMAFEISFGVAAHNDSSKPMKMVSVNSSSLLFELR